MEMDAGWEQAVSAVKQGGDRLLVHRVKVFLNSFCRLRVFVISRSYNTMEFVSSNQLQSKKVSESNEQRIGLSKMLVQSHFRSGSPPLSLFFCTGTGAVRVLLA